LVTHHIVSDAASRDILFREIAALYEAFSANKSSPLPQLPIRYGDFALWQRESLNPAVLEEHLSYWRKQIESVPTTLRLSTDRSRSNSQAFWGCSETAMISRPATKKLRDLSRRHGATLFMTLLAAFQALLFRYTGQPAFLIGVPFSGRTLPELQNLVGFFVSSLLFKADLSGEPTFLELLARVRDTALAAYAHPDVPFEHLHQELQTERDLSFHPLFQVMFAFQGDFTQPIRRGGVTFTPMEVDIGTAKFEVTLTVTERAQELAATFTYNTDLFDAATIRHLAAGFNTLIEEAVDDPGRSVSRLPLLTEADRQCLLFEWSGKKRQGVVNRYVHEQFGERAALTPDAIAVMIEHHRLNYGELDRKANQLARHLKGLAVGPGVLVGVYMDRCLDLLVAILGILKAGAAYVPLDPSYPAERLSFILKDTQAPVLLSQELLARTLPEHEAKVICLDSEWEVVSRESQEPPTAEVADDSLAYVIYTSGSTGKPKGVAITHKALANFVSSASDMFACDPHDRVLQFASMGFDTAVEEIFPCLIRGATLALRTDSMLQSVSLFLQKCRDWSITVLDLPTFYWHELTEKLYSEQLTLPEHVRLVIIGGDRAAPERFTQWQKLVGDHVRLLNTYGPTEATVVATVWESSGYAPKNALACEVPIGRPIPNVQTYILDRYLEPVPIGVPGELHIGGAGLARGYLNRPELTADRFIPNPFSEDLNSRLYKTGDLVRYLPDGNIEFVGRVDNQVKIRGFRIELGEIETVLAEHPAVRQAAVHLWKVQANDLRIVACCVPANAGALAPVSLRKHLRARLPEYMIPQYFLRVEEIPLTPNGKIDRSKLPVPAVTESRIDPHEAPSDAIETAIAEIWTNLIGPARSIGRADKFFEMGGHSLLALQALRQIENKLDVRLDLRVFFQESLAEIAMRCRSERVAGDGRYDGGKAVEGS
jgi:amino acid adenylation domain-containing protein